MTHMSQKVQLRVRGSDLMPHFSTEMSHKLMCNFFILNDSTCQFYYRDNICIRPSKKSGRGVTYLIEIMYYTKKLYFANYYFLLLFSSHKFHTDCLMDEVLPHLSVARRRKVEELQAELAASKKLPEDSQSVDSAKAVKVSRVDQVWNLFFSLF